MSTSVREGFYNSDGVLLVNGGTVDFSPVRQVASPTTEASGTSNLLSTLSFQPGAIGSDVGDADGFYSPLIKITNAGNHIYNAPIVSFGTSQDQLSAYCDGISDEQQTMARSILHDSVVAICPGDSEGEPGTVTLALTQGFSFGRPVLYISTDTSAGIAAALEAATYAPALANIPVGKDDSLFSSVERIFGFTNGPTNATDYSPLWDLNLGEWTQEAVDNGYRSRMTEEFSILGMVERGFLTGPGGSPYGSTGIIINCPIVQRLL